MKYYAVTVVTSRRCPSVWYSVWLIMARIATIEFLYALIVTSVVFAKLLHLYCYRDAIPTNAFLMWGPTFFFQDILFVALAWLLLSHDGPRKVRLVVVGAMCILRYVHQETWLLTNISLNLC